MKSRNLQLLLLIVAGLSATIPVYAERAVDTPTPRSVMARTFAYARSGPGTVISTAATTCYEWDASNTCIRGDQPTDLIGGGGGGEEKCIPATSYETCTARCACEYNNLVAKCRTVRCRQDALANRNLCEGMCITDWDPV
jgi:hypothetical protein